MNVNLEFRFSMNVNCGADAVPCAQLKGDVVKIKRKTHSNHVAKL